MNRGVFRCEADERLSIGVLFDQATAEEAVQRQNLFLVLGFALFVGRIQGIPFLACRICLGRKAVPRGVP